MICVFVHVSCFICHFPDFENSSTSLVVLITSIFARLYRSPKTGDNKH